MGKIKYEHNANPDDIVKIKVHLNMEHVSRWVEIRQQVEAWAIKNNFVVNTIQPIVAYEAGERQKVIKSQRKSDIQYLSSFVQRLGVDERTAAIGKELMED